jgi:protein dithiol:quinone oxidoreductase
MKINVVKNSSFWMLILTFVTLLTSLVLEHFLQLEPCPLCIMQRFCTVILAFFCLGHFVCQSWPKRWIFILSQTFFIVLGILLASRQLWLQLFIKESGSGVCLPGLEELLNYFSWDMVLKMLFWGSNDCATIAWRLMGMPLSVWSLVYFTVMFILIGCYIKQVKMVKN